MMPEQTLDEPIFIVDSATKVYQLFQEKERAIRVANSFFKELDLLDDVFINQPESDVNKDVVSVMSTAVAILVGSDAEAKYDNQLVKTEKNGFRKLKQNSNLLKQMKALPSYRKAVNAIDLVREFRFELATFCGPNNTSAFHMLDDVLYISLRSPSLCPVLGETVFEADYLEYLDKFIEIKREIESEEDNYEN